MKPLAIDFSPAPWISRQPPWLLGLATLLAIVALAGGTQLMILTAEAKALDAERRLAADSAAQSSASQAGLGLTNVQLNSINAVIRQLNAPWHAMFDVIERTAVPNVGILSLEPVPERGQILITAEARSSADMLAYLQSLQRQPEIARVDLLRHKTDESDPSHPLRFTLTVFWHGAPSDRGLR